MAGFLAFRRLDDFDTWWHLAAGRWIVTNGYVPDVDVLSFTARDHEWINLQWLFDVVLYGIHAIGGPTLLVVALSFTAMTLAALLLRNVSRSLAPAASSLLAICVLLVANERFMIRPEIVSFCFLQATLWILGSARDDDGKRLWLLAPLMLVWANMHALFVLGALAIAATVVGALAAEVLPLPARWRRATLWSATARNRLLVGAAAGAAAVFVNPFFVRGAFFPLELFSRIDGSDPVFSVIGEFRPPFSGYFPTVAIGAYQVYFVVGLVLVGLAGLLEALTTKRRNDVPRFDLSQVLLFAALAYLSTLARRNVGLFALGSAPLLAGSLRVLLDRIPENFRSRVAFVPALLVPALALSVSVAMATNWWFARGSESHEFGAGVFVENFPIRATEFIEEQGLKGPIFNDLTAGGYLTWADPTGDGVYLDGRLEVYDRDFFARYQNALADGGRFLAEVERYDIKTVVLFHRWGNRHRLITWLARRPDWPMVYLDETAVVFANAAAHGELLGAAQTAFAARRTEQLARLEAPWTSRRVPIARFTGLTAYARLLGSLGDSQGAFRLYEAAAKFPLSSLQRVQVEVPMAEFLLRAGRMNEAELHLATVEKLDPENEKVAQMRAWLAQRGG